VGARFGLVMKSRLLGRSGLMVSEVGFGAWAIGGSWGPVDEADANAALDAAIAAGVTFIDTADVYGDGRSERLVAAACQRSGRPIVVATKIGRRGPLEVASYRPENLLAWVDRCRENLERETLDLVQLHCPPTDVYYHPEIFAAMDDLVASGRVAHYGVSVERVEEGLKAIEYPGVETVQIIYNIFRQRPARLFFPEAARRQVGIIVRVPLASGLLTGKLRPETRFHPDDHRSFNRHGEQFDAGETFAGVDYATGLAAVEEIRALLPDGVPMAAFALRWILMSSAVSTVIPGARNAEQARANAAAAALPPIDAETMKRLADLYGERIAPLVDQRW
jgi:aryl-alcohol dehydrogenase-like predicted oxidoreductase